MAITLWSAHIASSGTHHAHRYQTKPGPLLGGVKQRLKWADGAAVKKELDAQLAAFLGPKTEADKKPLDKSAKKKKVASFAMHDRLHVTRSCSSSCALSSFASLMAIIGMVGPSSGSQHSSCQHWIPTLGTSPMCLKDGVVGLNHNGLLITCIKMTASSGSLYPQQPLADPFLFTTASCETANCPA